MLPEIPNRRAMCDCAEPDRVTDPCADRVDRAREGLAQRHRPGIGAGRVARAPAVDRDRLVDDRVGRLHPAFQCGEIDEQLPRRSRLALGLGRAIVDRIDIVAPADHRPHRTVAVDRHQRALRALGDIGSDGAVGGRLHARVKRRPNVDRIAGFVDQRIELGQRPIGEIAHAVLLGSRLDADRGGIDPGRGRRRYEAVFDHRIEHHPGAAARSIDVGGRRIIGRRLDQAGNDRGLAQRQPLGAMAEKGPAGGVDAIGAAAEIDAVEV